MSSPVTPLTPLQIVHQQQYDEHLGYFGRVLVALDQLVNVVFLRGHLDETISGHAARAAFAGKRWGLIACALLNKIEPNHAALALGADLGNAKIVESLEEKSGGLGG